ncbi:MAG: hypothetical protein IT210_17595 [Armatimonadetes bacterium]|nr:hypothetical protein [Armatimonadota bacterium]
MNFSDVRGQPERIRLGSAGGRWTGWQPFETVMTLSVPFRPARYQLKSRLGVMSDLLEIPAKEGGS